MFWFLYFRYFLALNSCLPVSLPCSIRPPIFSFDQGAARDVERSRDALPLSQINNLPGVGVAGTKQIHHPKSAQSVAQGARSPHGQKSGRPCKRHKMGEASEQEIHCPRNARAATLGLPGRSRRLTSTLGASIGAQVSIEAQEAEMSNKNGQRKLLLQTRDSVASGEVGGAVTGCSSFGLLLFFLFSRSSLAWSFGLPFRGRTRNRVPLRPLSPSTQGKWGYRHLDLILMRFSCAVP